MATQLILLIHGMGTHPEGEISKTFKQAINDGAKCLGLDDFHVEQEDCQLAEYNYSGLLDEVRKQFADNAAARQDGFAYLAGAGFAAVLIQTIFSIPTGWMFFSMGRHIMARESGRNSPSNFTLSPHNMGMQMCMSLPTRLEPLSRMIPWLNSIGTGRISSITFQIIPLVISTLAPCGCSRM